MYEIPLHRLVWGRMQKAAGEIISRRPTPSKLIYELFRETAVKNIKISTSERIKFLSPGAWD
jgi:hypothetical protein